ncbi:MAG TPA: aminoacyl-tRNA hydrolase [Glaciecola sp.]|nr:aminoacyl-tRNA hydrolase [Glaciecola sp.]MDG1468757.1 aminoacyl-tRNA hydrolase [Glaciecola sp.]MDG1922467.1 aminoacyl-tRNA hydrolase [Glaciecola sp.]HAB80278.1 aminoacyl-tRNA hydrolase [Glaciecola sp.]HAQ48962.1 aminoacyl-tRNA hydrolase [Glaciecola sp.]
MTDIRLIVGLGNPGPEYQNTRHNAGQMFVSSLARTFSCTLKPESKFFGLTGRTTIAGRDVRLLYPTTFMNLSGQGVAAIAQFYKIEVANILVAYDELDLPPGIAKFKVGGSSSQNGIRDIVARMGNQKDFIRLRIGIGHPGHKSRVTGYVLGKAPQNEQEKIDAAIDEAIRSTEILIKEDLVAAQQRLHSFSAE